jgi:hypothetical protein
MLVGVINYDFASAMQTFNRLAAVDLRDMSEEHHAALRRESIKLGISISDYFGKIIAETSCRLMGVAETPSEGGEA